MDGILPVIILILMLRMICRLFCRFNAKSRIEVVRGGGGGSKNEGERKLCPECSRTYKTASSFRRHPCCREKQLFVCHLCTGAFTRADSLKRHIETIHQGTGKKSQWRECLEEDCTLQFYNVSSMLKHGAEVHGWNAGTEIKEFASFSDFETWKESEDKKHFLNMYKRSGTVNGDIAYYTYTCNFQRQQPQWEQDETRPGSWKCGVTPALQCPARMLCRQNPKGDIEVTYLRCHNHLCDERQLPHCHLSKSDLAEIKEKLKLGVTVERIQADCQGDFGERCLRGTQTVEKRNLLTREQIRNVRRNVTRHRECDFHSTNQKLLRLGQDKFSPVIFWKADGEITAIGKPYLDSQADLVAIGLQSQEQLLMMEEGSHRIICIDGTHNTNRYGYELVNIVVPTEFGNGYPVAHFILSKVNKDDILIPVFKMIKERFAETGINFRPKVLMTDDDKMTGPAFRHVFGDDVQHFLCHWHVKNSWDSNLMKLENQGNRPVIRQFLHDLLHEPSKPEFHRLLQEFLDQYQNTEPTFVDYFRVHYVERAELWATAYREIFHAQTETNMYCESLHNKIKTYYMKRKPTRRLDDLVDILLKLEKDAWIDLFKKKNLGSQPVFPVLMAERHKNSETIPDDYVIQSSQGWFIKSSSAPNLIYQLLRIKEECSCTDRCSFCDGLCPHMFQCGCPEKNPICKHVHKLWTCLQNGIELLVMEQPDATFEAEMLVLSDLEPTRQNFRTFPVAEKVEFADDIIEPISGQTTDKPISDIQHNFPFTEKAENFPPASKLKKQTNWKSRRAFPLTNKEKIKIQRKMEKKELEHIRIASTKKSKTVSPQETILEDVSKLPFQQTSLDKSASEKHFGAPLKHGRDPVLEHEYRVGKCMVNVLDLKGIDASLSKREEIILKNKDSGFLVGCLTNRIIDAYFEVILRESSIAAVTSRWLQDFQEKGNFSVPFKIKDYEKILVPSNPTKRHWVLYVYDVKTESWEFLNSSPYSHLGGHYINAIQQLHRQFNLGNALKVTIPKRSTQEDDDDTSCGVYICFYAKMCKNQQPYDTLFDVDFFRKEIYNDIVANIAVES